MEGKGKPFQNMAHEDVTSDFKKDFIGKAQKLAIVESRTGRVSGLFDIFIDLNTFITQNGIQIEEVNKRRGDKIKEKGKFDLGFIRVREGSPNKLVRDRIPGLPAKEGNENDTYRKSENKEEFLKELDLKLAEEAIELMQEARTREQRIDELADVYEVMDAILKYRNIDIQEIEKRHQSNDIIQRRI